MFELWVDPENGSDTSPGSSTLPLKTLDRASAILTSIAPDDSVRVWVAPCDVVVPEPMIWRYSHPLFQTHIRGSAGSLTKFSGGGLLDNDILKIMPTRRGEMSNLRFTGFSLRDAKNGLAMAGDRDDELSGWIGGIEVSGVFISMIGTKYAGQGYGAGAIRMVNARDCDVFSVQTHYLENTEGEHSHMHALYVAHHSSGNRIDNLTISNCAGDPFRTRDQSHDNLFENCSISSSGDEAIFSDWYCTGPTCTKAGGEAASYGNKVRNNVATWAGYDGQNVAMFKLYGEYSGVVSRVSTLGNERT